MKYLEENKEDIISFVDSTQRAAHGMTEMLAEVWPDTNGKDRQELANAIMSVMWLGYRSQDRRMTSSLRDAILEAFEAGRRYARMQ